MFLLINQIAGIFEWFVLGLPTMVRSRSGSMDPISITDIMYLDVQEIFYIFIISYADFPLHKKACDLI
jgi:hypothetical protein